MNSLAVYLFCLYLLGSNQLSSQIANCDKMPSAGTVSEEMLRYVDLGPIWHLDTNRVYGPGQAKWVEEYERDSLETKVRVAPGEYELQHPEYEGSAFRIFGYSQGNAVLSKSELSACDIKDYILGIKEPDGLNVKIYSDPGEFLINGQDYEFAYIMKRVARTSGPTRAFEIKSVQLADMYFSLGIMKVVPRE